MRYVGKHERQNWWWAALCWLLAAVFFAVGMFYVVNDSMAGGLIWLTLAGIWLYISLGETARIIRTYNNNNRNRTNA